jgi:hypothetical protein
MDVIRSFDYPAFRAWMESRKYSNSTIVGALSNLHRLERDGAATIDDIDRIYAGRTCKARLDLRWAFRLYLDFMNANRPTTETFDRDGFWRHLDDALLDITEIVDARAAGATYAELTARFGQGPCALKNILSRHGMHGSPNMRRRVPVETKREMVALSRQGMSHVKIAAVTGWSLGAIERVLRDWVDE